MEDERRIVGEAEEVEAHRRKQILGSEEAPPEPGEDEADDDVEAHSFSTKKTL